MTTEGEFQIVTNQDNNENISSIILFNEKFECIISKSENESPSESTLNDIEQEILEIAVYLVEEWTPKNIELTCSLAFNSNKSETAKNLKKYATKNSSLRFLKKTKQSEDNGSSIWIVVVSIFSTIAFLTVFGVISYFVLKWYYNYMEKKIVQDKKKKTRERFDTCTECIDIESYNIQYEQNECAICLDKFENEQNYRVIKAWEHIFHDNWIGEYFKINVKAKEFFCPVCKSPTETSPNDEKEEA